MSATLTLCLPLVPPRSVSIFGARCADFSDQVPPRLCYVDDDRGRRWTCVHQAWRGSEDLGGGHGSPRCVCLALSRAAGPL